MSSGKEKQKEIAKDTATEQAIAKVEAPNPFQQKIDAQTQNVLDWEDGTGAFAGQPKDITKLPGIDTVLDLYSGGHNRAAHEMFGHGAGAFSNTANGAYGDQLKMKDQFDRDQARAEAISSAARAIHEQAHGVANTSIERDIARNINVAKLRQENQTAYYGRPKSVNPMLQALGFGMQGLNVAGKGGLGWTPFG